MQERETKAEGHASKSGNFGCGDDLRVRETDGVHTRSKGGLELTNKGISNLSSFTLLASFSIRYATLSLMNIYRSRPPTWAIPLLSTNNPLRRETRPIAYPSPIGSRLANLRGTDVIASANKRLYETVSKEG